MKKIVTIVLFFLLICNQVKAAVYEASTLHNAVTRSETVQDLFNKRWEEIIDKNLLIDIYGKINWVNDFKINTYNSGTGQEEAVDMTLVRTYGSITINIPIMGGGFGSKLKGKFSNPTPIYGSKDAGNQDKKQVTASNSDTSYLETFWNKNSLLLGFTATGFHYGLTRETTVDRGSAGDETVTDYKYTQFFDDIFAVSLLYNPKVFIHMGIIVNNQIEPDDDGTMDYSNSSSRSKRYFFSSNIFSFLNVNAASKSDSLESLSFDVDITDAASNFTPIPELIPGFKIGYQLLKLYQDESYDAVWVDSVYQSDGTTFKTDSMDNSEKITAKLHLVNFHLDENLNNTFFVKLFAQYQFCNKDLYDKRNNEKIEMAIFKEKRAIFGINFFGLDKSFRYQSLEMYFGLSSYWDPAVAVHRESGDSYRIKGWIFGLEYKLPFFGADFAVKKNYSQELRSLVEATDKYVIEGSMFFRI